MSIHSVSFTAFFNTVHVRWRLKKESVQCEKWREIFQFVPSQIRGKKVTKDENLTD